MRRLSLWHTRAVYQIWKTAWISKLALMDLIRIKYVIWQISIHEITIKKRESKILNGEIGFNLYINRFNP